MGVQTVNAGYKADAEADTLAMFAKAMKIMAAYNPQNARLQAYAKKVNLTAIMVLTKQIQEIRQGNTIKDRLRDCAECRKLYGLTPCAVDGRWGTAPCIYTAPEWRKQFIEKHFGEDGLGAVDAFCEWAEKELEGMKDAGEKADHCSDGRADRAV